MQHETRSLAKVLAISAILKAGGVGEFISIAAAELALKKALKRVHREASEKVIALLGKSVPAVTAAEQFSARAGRTYNSVYLAGTEELIEPHVDKVYRLGKQAAVRRLTGKIRGEYVYDYSAALGKAEELPTFEIGFSFQLVDQRAVDAVAAGHFFWFGDHYDKSISEIIKNVISNATLRRGLGPVEAGEILQKELRRELGLVGGGRKLTVPSGWQGTFDEYFEALAAYVTTAARAASTVQAIEEAEAVYLVIINPEDERTCPRCMIMSGKQFRVDQARGQLDALLGAESTEDVKRAQPWYSVKEFLKIGDEPGNVSEADSARFAAAGVVLPPYHMKCRCTVDLAPGHEVE